MVWTHEKISAEPIARHDNPDVTAAYTVLVRYSCDDGRTLDIPYSGIITAQNIDNAINNQLDSLNGLAEVDAILAPAILRVIKPGVQLTDEQRAVLEKTRALASVSAEAVIRARGDTAELAALDDLKRAQQALDEATSADAAVVEG